MKHWLKWLGLVAGAAAFGIARCSELATKNQGGSQPFLLSGLLIAIADHVTVHGVVDHLVPKISIVHEGLVAVIELLEGGVLLVQLGVKPPAALWHPSMTSGENGCNTTP